jgi:hypothetical protein
MAALSIWDFMEDKSVPKMTAYRAIYPGPQRQANAPALPRTECGAMAYAEITDGAVEEYEAIESTVMNRVASGLKYWVDKDKRSDALNEDNVITAKSPKQYLGVGGTNYELYRNGHNDRGARNAAEADRILTETGRPTTKAVSFIVHPDGSPPTDHEVMNLGRNLEPAGKVGRVYLYQPKSTTRR